ncbi:kelch domain-containing protein 1-like [Megalops cyprinoides]|uniref:kelch domain-containing protein 1-like n=1 Tax=Megalops cyprinoides TaxID=118141 RepID=UPI00186555C2|nr:kelch domain-containing protein 1-like [Megalops cyprinoides]
MDSTAELRMWSPRERSDHTAFVEGDLLYVWGGYHSVAGEEVFLPSDEICLYDMSSGIWETQAMTGDVPPSLSQTCGCCLNGVMYIFGGCNDNGHTNQLYWVNLLDGMFAWRKVTDTKGTPPSPRDRHSCWVYRDRIIYFGGYGCKQLREVNDSQSFITDEASWATIGTALFRFWGWNNEVHVYDPKTATWNEPQTNGVPPTPRAAHCSATLGSRGYVCGGVEATAMDMHFLDLESWTWTKVVPTSTVPMGRSWHTLTAVSDSALFLFGGLSATGKPLSDAWVFDVQTKEWTELEHSHRDQPRLWHSACLGNDSDVIVFGGSRDYTLLMDTISALQSPSQSHCSDVLVFQTQPYPLIRLCEDCIVRNSRILQEQLLWLPAKFQEIIQKRTSCFRPAAKPQERSIPLL